VNELKKYKSQRQFSKNYLRGLKQSEGGGGETTKPGFTVENSGNILVVEGKNQEAVVLVESFLQANLKARTKYKCCALHHCARENRLTWDPYYITKNIILSIVKAIPSIKSFFKMQEHNFLKEMLSKQQVDKLDLQIDYADLLVKFCKVLKEIKLDFNVGVFITGAENLFRINRLDNFIYILRSASVHIPSYLRFVLTVDQREDSTNFQKLLSILGTTSVIRIDDETIFKNEAKSYLEFALAYKPSSHK